MAKFVIECTKEERCGKIGTRVRIEVDEFTELDLANAFLSIMTDVMEHDELRRPYALALQTYVNKAEKERI